MSLSVQRRHQSRPWFLFIPHVLVGSLTTLPSSRVLPCPIGRTIFLPVNRISRLVRKPNRSLKRLFDSGRGVYFCSKDKVRIFVTLRHLHLYILVLPESLCRPGRFVCAGYCYYNRILPFTNNKVYWFTLIVGGSDCTLYGTNYPDFFDYDWSAMNEPIKSRRAIKHMLNYKSFNELSACSYLTNTN